MFYLLERSTAHPTAKFRYTEIKLYLELYKQSELNIKRIDIILEDLDNSEWRKLQSQYLPNYIIQIHVLLKATYKIAFKPLPYCVFQEDNEITFYIVP